MKKRSIYLFSFISFLTLHTVAQHRSIAFEHTALKDLKERALKENKLIFIDGYTTWCGPCKYLNKYVFTNDTVADYYNTNFINAKFDMEKGEGIEIAKQYQVSCYPTLLFIDGNGNLVHRTAGSSNPAVFTELGKTAKNPEKNFSYYKKNYDTKKNDPAFLADYIEAITGSCLDAKSMTEQYFSLQKEEELINEKNWEMIENHTTSLDSREFKYLIAHKAEFEKVYTPQRVDGKIMDVAQSSLNTIISVTPFNAEKYKQAKEKIFKMNLSNSKIVVFESDLALAKKNKDWAAYSKLAVENVDIYYLKNSNELNSIAWDFYENVTDKKALLKAEEWARQSVELKPEYANLDTYASVLYKNGKKDLALETAGKAIECAKKENYPADEYKSTTELLEKIKLLK